MHAEQLVAVGEVAVERDGLDRTGQADHAKLLRERRVERTVGMVQQARAAAAFAQRAQRADVIEVRVRVKQVARPQAVPREPHRDCVDVVTAVDDDRFAAFRVAENRAVAREHADREGLDDHNSILKSR